MPVCIPLLPLLGMNRHDSFDGTPCVCMFYHISWKKRYVYEMNHSSLGRITLRSKAKGGQLVHFTTPLSQISVELWLFGGLKPRKNMFETFRKASMYLWSLLPLTTVLRKYEQSDLLTYLPNDRFNKEDPLSLWQRCNLQIGLSASTKWFHSIYD